MPRHTYEIGNGARYIACFDQVQNQRVLHKLEQKSDFCTTFGIYKNGGFRSIGMNVLSRPL